MFTGPGRPGSWHMWTLCQGSSWCTRDQKRRCPLSDASQMPLLTGSVPAGRGAGDGSFAEVPSGRLDWIRSLCWGDYLCPIS